MNNGHLDENLKKAFEEQQAIMQKIVEMGFAQYVKALPGLVDAFDLGKHKAGNFVKCVCCMDERTPLGIHCAGSGILLSDEDFEKYFDWAKPDAISSHDGCGAGKLYAKKIGFKGDSDLLAKEWAEKKAKEKGITHIHLGVEKPFHFARVCYYDGTGKFNYQGVEGLPAGFVVDRKCMTKEASLAECAVAKTIIFGDHGFGNLLNENNPFIFVAVAESEQQLTELKAELSEMAKDYGKEVLVDGFFVN
jgi:hypothetical protein